MKLRPLLRRLRSHASRALALAALLLATCISAAAGEGGTLPVGSGVELPVGSLDWQVTLLLLIWLAGRSKPTLRIEHIVTGDEELLRQLGRPSAAAPSAANG